MKKVFIKMALMTFVITLMSLTSCKKDEIGNDGNGGGNDGGGGNNVTEIVATNTHNLYPELGDMSDIATVKIITDTDVPFEDEFVIAQSDFKDNGFVLQLPSELDESFLRSVDSYCENYNVSDANAMIYGDMDETVFDAFDENDSHIGFFMSEGNDCQLGLIYVDRNVKINGTRVYSSTYETINYTYDLDLIKGWNIVYYITDKIADNTYNCTYTSTKLSDTYLNWYYYYDNFWE